MHLLQFDEGRIISPRLPLNLAGLPLLHPIVKAEIHDLEHGRCSASYLFQGLCSEKRVCMFRFALYMWVIGRRIVRGAVARLLEISRGNAIGVVLLVVTIFYSARLHTWSKTTLWDSVRETVLAPCLLLLCGLCFVHLLQSAHGVYIGQRRPFPTALGTVINIPPWYFQWRCWLITIICLIFPVIGFLEIWSPLLLTLSPPFAVDWNATVLLPDLHVLNNVPYTPPPDKDRPPSLLDLFTNDYPENMKFRVALKKKGSSLGLKEQVYLDFLGKSEFVAFYVPASSPIGDDGATSAICEALAREVRPMIDDLPRKVGVQSGYNLSNAIDLRDLTFTNLVLIYHESALTITEQAEIISVFKDDGLNVQFRGPDYENSRDALWEEAQRQRAATEPQVKPIVTFPVSHASQIPVTHLTETRGSDDSVDVSFTVYNPSDVAMGVGAVVMRICKVCRYSGEPSGFIKQASAGGSDSDRERDFQHLWAKSALVTMTARVKVPPNVRRFEVGIFVSCANCVPAIQQPLWITLPRLRVPAVNRANLSARG